MELEYDGEKVFARDADGAVIAEADIRTEDGVADIWHVFVDESLRGQGVAGKLVREAAERIAAEGKTMTATCSYASLWFTRHPEFANYIPAEQAPSCSVEGRH